MNSDPETPHQAPQHEPPVNQPLLNQHQSYPQPQTYTQTQSDLLYQTPRQPDPAAYTLPPGFFVNVLEPDGFVGDSVYFTNTKIRHAFVRKVFGLISTQVIITIMLVGFIKYYPPINVYLMSNAWLIWVLMGGTFMLMFVLGCSESVARSYPTNFILLLSFTIMESFLIGFISLAYQTDTLFLAAMITGVVVIGLTLFSFQTKMDFTGNGVYFFLSVFILLGFGMLCALFRSHFLMLVYSVMGAALFSMYLVFDMQLMMAGKHKYSISPEDYILAALNLYMDIINLFLMILRLVSAAKD